MSKLVKNGFARNVITVALGAGGAQLITIVASPLITRLYGPEAFGAHGVFVSLAAILVPVAALTYPTAIVLPRSDIDALALARLSVCIGIVTAVSCALILWFFEPVIIALINVDINGFIYFLPLYMLFSVISGASEQWLMRKRAFRLSANVSIWQSAIVNAVKVGVGAAHPTSGTLIATSTAGLLLYPVLRLAGARKEQLARSPTPGGEASSLLQAAKRHWDFPLLRAPQVLLSAASLSLPAVMLSALFGSASAGFYMLAFSVLGMPSNLLGKAVTQVFYPRVNEAAHHGQSVRSLVVRATLAMSAIGILPFALIVVAGPTLFSIAFGPDWAAAGVYAQWLSPWLFFGYINKPAVAAIPVLKIQGGLLIYEIISTSSKAAALLIGYYITEDAGTAIAMFSISGAVSYLAMILWVVRSAASADRQSLQHEHTMELQSNA